MSKRRSSFSSRPENFRTAGTKEENLEQEGAAANYFCGKTIRFWEVQDQVLGELDLEARSPSQCLWEHQDVEPFLLPAASQTLLLLLLLLHSARTEGANWTLLVPATFWELKLHSSTFLVMFAWRFLCSGRNSTLSFLNVDISHHFIPAHRGTCYFIIF